MFKKYEYESQYEFKQLCSSVRGEVLQNKAMTPVCGKLQVKLVACLHSGNI